MSETLPRWGLPELNMFDTDPTKVKAEMVAEVEENLDRSLAEADPLRLALNGVAALLIQHKVADNTAYQQNLLSYAQNGCLDALGHWLRVERLGATGAVTTIRFTLSEALGEPYSIPQGTEVTNGIVTFATNEELVIASGELSGDVLASCTESGKVGNGYLEGQIATIVKPMTFVKSAKNITTTSGGADEESDARYADRISLTNNVSTAGPEDAYRALTLSASPAIIDAKPHSPTPGVVNVYPLLEGGELPTDSIIETVLNYLSAKERRPMTDDVHVLAPEAVDFTINVDFWISRNDKTQTEAIRARVESAVEEYRLWQQTKIGRDITPEKLSSLVMNAGASRIDSATMSPASFQDLSEGQVAQCKGVTITYRGLKDE